MSLEKLKEYKKLIDEAVEKIEAYKILENEINTLENQLREKKKERREAEKELKYLSKKLTEAGFIVPSLPFITKPHLPCDKFLSIPDDTAEIISKKLDLPKDEFVAKHSKKLKEFLERYPTHTLHFNCDLVYKIMEVAAEEGKITPELLIQKIPSPLKGTYRKSTILRRLFSLSKLGYLIKEKGEYLLNLNYLKD
ncbi:MAG: hypothetical protein QXS48_03870 [Candidatus Aenigmatarchaeota archaeon]